MQVDRIQHKHTHTQRHICVYNIIYIYIWYSPPPMNYPPSFCVVNTVLNQLSRQVRICISQRFCISQRLPNTNHISIECASQLVQVNVSVRSNATLCSSNQKPISLGKPKNTKTMFWELYGQTLKRCFLVFPRKKLFRCGKQTFSKEKIGPENQLFPRENHKNKKNKKHTFCETMWPKSKKIGFFGCHRKKLFFRPNTIVLLGKSWFFCTHLFAAHIKPRVFRQK